MNIELGIMSREAGSGSAGKPITYNLSAKTSPAFTLMELLVVMGIMSVLATLGLLVGMDFYRSYAFNSERDTVVALLQKARNQSLNNMGQMEHGIHFDNSKYVLFQAVSGTAYSSTDSNNQKTDAHPGITNSLLLEIRFTQLSANTAGGTLNLTDGKRSTSISVNSEGRIEW